MPLFNHGAYTLHSGGPSMFKIDCDALTDADWDALARLVASRIWFEEVVGIPRGGLRFAASLMRYVRPLGPLLIVDDVLTTGASMGQKRLEISARDPEMPVLGCVIFARGPVPPWVTALFRMAP